MIAVKRLKVDEAKKLKARAIPKKKYDDLMKKPITIPISAGNQVPVKMHILTEVTTIISPLSQLKYLLPPFISSGEL